TVLLHDSDITAAPGSWRAALGALPILAEQWAAVGLRVGPLADHGIVYPALGGFATGPLGPWVT
ncbi:MAG: hypothetical protein J2P57_25785, partial [Acidimicrobiaceae bacterium]|nr:hypothetical protein [Acidimicrobiaceae bacterium]